MLKHFFITFYLCSFAVFDASESALSNHLAAPPFEDYVRAVIFQSLSVKEKKTHERQIIRKN